MQQPIGLSAADDYMDIVNNYSLKPVLAQVQQCS